jgi:hypothetical protein
MSRINELKSEIESLPSEEFTKICRWLSEKDWARWDKEIETDSQAGRLDFLAREARGCADMIAYPKCSYGPHAFSPLAT